MRFRDFGFPTFAVSVGLVLVFVVSGCGTTNLGEGDECDPGVETNQLQCPPIQQADGGNYAQFCEVTFEGVGQCNNVCAFAANQRPNVLPADEGEFCVFDADCGTELTCDNDTIGAETPCHCIPEEGMAPGVDCSGVTPGNGGFRAPCRDDGDCEDGLPCCTSSEVSSACGTQVGFCECI